MLVAVVTPSSSPQSAGADQLMHTLLRQPLPGALAPFDRRAGYVTGNTPPSSSSATRSAATCR